MSKKGNSSIIAIVAMIFLFGMISFVTNLAAPIGNIWKMQPGIEGSNFWGMMGNMMNFLAYAIMGIPAGKMLTKYGYKKTALIAIAVGFLGVFIQFLSGIVGVGGKLAGLPANFFVYLLGAFVAGFSMCMLNTVVNPMLKLLGGARSNQYIQIGGSFNSLMGTLTPMLVGALIGTLTKDTLITDVNPVLFLAMGVFAFAFIVLLFVDIKDPEAVKDSSHAVSPMKYKHFVLGVIAIFVYVGVEVGIPGTLNFYLSDPVKGAGMDPSTAVAIAGFVAGTYGGYVAVPVVRAAHTLHIPCVIHESDVTPGLANKLCFSSADKVCCNFPETLEKLPADKAVLTGTPIREDLFTGSREEGLKLCGFTDDKPVLMVTGGSQGAASVNSAVRENLDALLKDFQIVHLCGKDKMDNLRLTIPGYKQFEFVSDEMKHIFAMADVVISRAGAGAISELLALKKPNILVPLAHDSRGDQILNADSYRAQGYSMVVTDEELPETIVDAVQRLYSEREQYIHAMEQSSQGNAIATILEQIELFQKK